MFRLREEQLGVLSKEVAANNIISALEAGGHQATWHPESNQVLARDPRGHVSRLIINNQGHLSEHQTPLGRSYLFQYDDNRQLSAITMPSGLHATLAYDERGLMQQVATSPQQSVRFAWNEDGSLAHSVLPDSSTVKMTYESGRLCSYTDRAGKTASFDWDTLGRLTAIDDFNRHRTKYEYGNWNRPKRIVRPDGSSEEIVRNRAGRPTLVKSNGEIWARIESDEAARITRISYADGHFVSLTYNEGGLVVEGANPTLVVKREYDDKGRLLLEDQGGEIVRYEYDQSGLLNALTGPTGETIRFRYDADARLDQVTDWKGESHAFAHDNADKAIQHRMPNGITTTTLLSPMGSPLSVITSELAGGLPPLSLRFAWDTTGKLARKYDSETGVKTFVYDAEGRIVGAQSVSSAETFSYDFNGNRTFVNGTRAQFDSADRLLQQGASNFEYDARGNLIVESGPLGKTRYSYNGQNLLIAAQLPGGARVEYAYDAFARLVWRTSGKIKTRFIWAGDQLLAEVTTSLPTPERRDYIFVPYSYCPLSMRLNGSVYYYITDHKGSPRWLLDRGGRVRWSADSETFGESVVLRNEVEQPFRFAGHYRDRDTGLHYNRARYYSPALGRYLSRDPMDIASGLNLYIYAENDPIKKSDPLGLMTFWQGVGAAALMVAGAALLVVFIPVVVAAVVAVAKGAAVAAGTAAAVIAVVGGAALVGAGIGLAVAPSGGSLKCKIHYALRGAVIGAGAAIAVMGGAFGAAGLVGGVGGGMALAGGGAIVASTDAVLGQAAGAIATGIVMMTGGGTGGGDEYDDDDDDGGGRRGEKGKSFRGGKKSERDNWYGKNDKDFQRWWHREGKAASGGKDIDNAEEAQRAYDQWVSEGKPKVDIR